MILADTSVWIDHFHKAIPALAEALEREEVLMHPFVIGELACGELARRREVLALLSTLPGIIEATTEEVLRFIEDPSLMGKGTGFLDAHLLPPLIPTPESPLCTHDHP